MLAADLIRAQECSAQCLHAAVDEDACQCRCRGRFHGALRAVEVPEPATQYGFFHGWVQHWSQSREFHVVVKVGRGSWDLLCEPDYCITEPSVGDPYARPPCWPCLSKVRRMRLPIWQRYAVEREAA